jgi:hypothetical protein
MMTTDVGLMSAAGILFMLGVGAFYFRYFMKQMHDEEAPGQEMANVGGNDGFMVGSVPWQEKFDRCELRSFEWPSARRLHLAGDVIAPHTP